MEMPMKQSYTTKFFCYLWIQQKDNENTVALVEFYKQKYLNKFLSFVGSFTINNKLNYYIKF